jgi:uncharacterized membrane protein HdeD (DUF308 family)
MVVVARNWWALVLRGVPGVLFGLITFVAPAAALAALVLLFGAYALVDGIFNIVAALRDARGERGWWTLLLSGIAGVLAGLVAFAAPGLTALVLLYVIAVWAVVTGVLEIAAAIRLRRHVTGEWLMALNGALSVVFGALVIIAPMIGALTVVLLIGAYAFVSGLLLIALGVRLRGAIRESPERTFRRTA